MRALPRRQLFDHQAVALGLGDSRRRGIRNGFERVSHPSRPLRHSRRGAAAAPSRDAGRPAVGVSRFGGPVGAAERSGRGGGYFRLFPLPWTVYCLDRINRAERQPFVFYVHPWEVDPEQPRIAARSRLSRLRHYVNLAKNHGKLDGLLRRFRFGHAVRSDGKSC